MPEFSLPRLPLKAKWLITLVLSSYALNHLFAAWLVWEVTHNVDASAQEHFAYKSFAVMLRMAHQHTFGHGTMFFLTGAVFLMAAVPQWLTLLLYTGAFLGAYLDLASWFLLKYSSPRWELLSAAGGTMYAVSFLAMAGIILRQMWRWPS